jgi:hypothetical protein
LLFRIKLLDLPFILLTGILASCSIEPLSSQQSADLKPGVTVFSSTSSKPGSGTENPITPQPANSSMPNLSQTQGVLDCAEIANAHKESSAKEWEAIKNSYRGQEMYYTGTVYSVTETDAVHMSGSLCHATLHHVPHEIAVNLSHGQFIEGYGTILNINYYLGEDVDIEVNPDLIFVR